MTPFFSIIIPVYNVAPYLRECLDSVLAQTFEDWEAICVDDGSTDSSGMILNEYACKDKRFRIFHQKNAGPSVARNKGLVEAKGEWIWFVDADDILKSMALSTFNAISKKADVTFFSMEMMNDDGFRCMNCLKPISYIELNEDSSLDLLKLMRNSLGVDAFGWTCDKIIRRKIVMDNGIRFDGELNYFEDEIFALNLFLHARSFSCLDDVFYVYRIVNNGLTRSGRKDCFLIGKAFADAVVRTKWKGLRELAYVRATYFLRQSFNQRQKLRAASRLLCLYRMYGKEIEQNGRFWKLVAILSHLPLAVGSVALVVVAFMRLR